MNSFVSLDHKVCKSPNLEGTGPRFLTFPLSSFKGLMGYSIQDKIGGVRVGLAFKKFAGSVLLILL